MRLPVRITPNLQIIVEPNSPPLTGRQAFKLAGDLLRRGAHAIAAEELGPAPTPRRPRPAARRRAAVN